MHANTGHTCCNHPRSDSARQCAAPRVVLDRTQQMDFAVDLFVLAGPAAAVTQNPPALLTENRTVFSIGHPLPDSSLSVLRV
jgi:hypothetical protein